MDVEPGSTRGGGTAGSWARVSSLGNQDRSTASGGPAGNATGGLRRFTRRLWGEVGWWSGWLDRGADASGPGDASERGGNGGACVIRQIPIPLDEEFGTDIDYAVVPQLTGPSVRGKEPSRLPRSPLGPSTTASATSAPETRVLEASRPLPTPRLSLSRCAMGSPPYR